MKKIVDPDQRSKKFIFVPFCLMCQAFQARGIVRFGFSSTIKPIMDELLNHDVNIIQMPCPESQLGGYEKGLRRNPQGISQYNTSEFIEICERVATEVAEMIKGILSSGYTVVGILGMEYSPSCSIKLQYSHRGTFHQPGIFIEALQNILERERINIPFIGVNRRGIRSSLKRILELFEEETLFK